MTSVTSAAAATTTATATSSTSTDTASSISNDEFLQILMTQLENQNPLDPMDVKDFTAQLTNFSQLEQQISTNDKLDDISSLLSSTMTLLLNGADSAETA